MALSGGSVSNGLSLVVLRLISRAEPTTPALAVEVAQVLQQLPLGVVVAAADGQVIFSNNRLRAMFLWPDDTPVAPLGDSIWLLYNSATGEPLTPEESPFVRTLQHGEATHDREYKERMQMEHGAR